jgi:hypothetical protein
MNGDLMRFLRSLVCIAALFAPLSGATLRRLTLDDMIEKTTAIVRGKVQKTSTAYFKGSSVLYTHYQVQVAEQWKGSPATQMDIAIPGGEIDGLRQVYAGAPALVDGQEYVLYLWTSKSGLTQVIGLSQGLFALQPAPGGDLVVTRAGSGEAMVDGQSGLPVQDEKFTMRLVDMRARVNRVLGN